MRTRAKIRLLPWLIILALLAGAVLFVANRLEKEEPDPHEGQVYINDGFGMVWMTPLEGVPVNDLAAEELLSANGTVSYVGERFTTLRGIDVSEHQKEIDWAQVAAAGVDFAMIRACRRGYTEGNLYTDPYFEKNIQGALHNGIKVGVYVFSQAITVSEALEEANYVLDLIRGYNVTMPVVFDWEKIEDEADARTNNLDSAILNDCAVAFCEKVKMAGYTPAVYFNRLFGYYRYDLTRLTDYLFWLSVPDDFPYFYYASDMWQYSFAGQVPGVSEPVDMNLYFTPVPGTGEDEPAAEEKTGKEILEKLRDMIYN